MKQQSILDLMLRIVINHYCLFRITIMVHCFQLKKQQNQIALNIHHLITLHQHCLLTQLHQ